MHFLWEKTESCQLSMVSFVQGAYAVRGQNCYELLWVKIINYICVAISKNDYSLL